MEREISINMSAPYFSIIIPTKNEEVSLGKLLKSLQKQSFKDFEIIIVDGGSTDNTADVAEQFSAKVFVKKGCKEFPSRNFGARCSNGRILVFSSADILLPENILRHLAQKFEEDNVSGICGVGMPFEAPFWMKIEYLAHWRLLRIWAMISRDFHGSANFMAVRKSDFHEIGGFSDEFCADTILFNELGRKKKVRMLSGASFFVSGRRAKKMGFLKFNAYFLWVIIFDYIPFLRDSPIMRVLKNYSLGYKDMAKFQARIMHTESQAH